MIIVGTGNIAKEYVKILHYLREPITVLGNTESTSLKFSEWARGEGIQLDLYYGKNALNIDGENCIIAVPIPSLFEVARDRISRGAKEILIEKPVTLYSIQMKSLLKMNRNTELWVAYNRRFFQSVKRAKEIIQANGLRSMDITFGERVNNINKFPAPVSQRWIISNSSHCIDAAFYIAGGLPTELNAVFHSPYVGNGKFNQGVFNYSSDWAKDWNWKIDFTTLNGGEYKLSPIESLLKKQEGEWVDFCHESEKRFKPGFLPMVESFLGNKKGLVSGDEQYKALKLYSQIGGYPE